MRKQIHVTSIESLAGCAEKFRRRYIIDDQPADPKVYQIVGSAVDDAVTFNLAAKINGDTVPRELIEEVANNAVVAHFNNTKFDPAFPYEAALVACQQKAVRLALLHYDEVAPVIQPTHVQHKVSTRLDEFLAERGVNYEADLVGMIDIREGLNVIRDTKTSTSKPAPNAAKWSLQLSGYALASILEGAEPPITVHLDYLVDYKRGPQYRHVQGVRTWADIADYLDLLELACTRLAENNFPARPSWKCNMCDYRGDCVYEQNQETGDGGSLVGILAASSGEYSEPTWNGTGERDPFEASESGFEIAGVEDHPRNEPSGLRGEEGQQHEPEL